MTWLGRRNACQVLGIGKDRLASLARSGLVRSRLVGTHRQYHADDVAELAASWEQPVARFEPEAIDPRGWVPAMPREPFLDRLDRCWLFLWLHGYLDGVEAESVRLRIKSAIDKAGSNRRYYCDKAL